MTRRVQASRLISLVFLVACLGLSAQPGLPLHVSSFMTPQEMQATGVAGLNTAQRAALDQWLNRYTKLVIRTSLATDSAGPTITASGEYITGRGHWIDEVSSNGAIVTLEDGSMWDIATIDRIDTAIWLPTTDITVMRDRRLVGDYKYVLVNTEDGEKAHARYLGKH